MFVSVCMYILYCIVLYVWNVCICVYNIYIIIYNVLLLRTPRDNVVSHGEGEAQLSINQTINLVNICVCSPQIESRLPLCRRWLYLQYHIHNVTPS